MKRYIVLSIVFGLCLTLSYAERFSIIHTSDIHASFSTKTNCMSLMYPWITAHLTNVNDSFGVVAGPVVGVVMTGDCYEDDRLMTNGLGNGTYYSALMTNEVRALIDAGCMVFITDGNHDANNTNNVVGWCHTNAINLWNDVFPAKFFTNQTYFATNKDAGVYNNMVMKFTRGNINLKFISYHCEPNTNIDQVVAYSGQTAWVRQQINADPAYNTIICAHYFLGMSSPGLIPDTDPSYTNIVPSFYDHNQVYWNIGPGKAVIDEGLHNLGNTLGFMSGHNLKVFKGIYITNGIDGHQVTFSQFNTQAGPTVNGDTLDVWTFDTVASSVEIRTYRISTASFLTDYDSTFTSALWPYPRSFRANAVSKLPIAPRVFPFIPR